MSPADMDDAIATEAAARSARRGKRVRHMIGLDTNVFVRYLALDDPRQQ